MIPSQRYRENDSRSILDTESENESDYGLEKENTSNDDVNENTYEILREKIQSLFVELENNKHIETSERNDKYIYKGIEMLESKIEDLVCKNGQSIYVCAYQVNTEKNTPFLQYFMHKVKVESIDSEKSAIMSLPSFKYDANKMSSYIDVMQKCIDILDILYISYHVEDDVYGNYKGYTLYEDSVYIFFDCSIYNIDSHYIYKANDLWLVLMDEIINHHVVSDIPINDSVVDFFMNHVDLLYLVSKETGLFFPKPMAVYSASYNYMIEFTLQFDKVPDVKFNNYYLFTNYPNSFELAKKIKNEKHKDTKTPFKMGIIRHAIFTNETTLLSKEEWDNFLSLKKDECSETYYFSDNGIPYWLIRNSDNQLALSGHYIKKDSTTLI